ncbi:MAG: hypothetical protein IKU73_05900 [Clostridia bacterium]|nr:hypothetical protein [Clostridia bacterium]
MGRLSEKKRAEALEAYFGEGLEAEAIASRLGVSVRSVSAVLRDPAALAPYRARSEAAKLRAQICVNESAEEAARKQAALLMVETESVSQRAAKDILDRAGVRMAKGDRTDVTIRFAGGAPVLGMPKREDEQAWS